MNRKFIYVLLILFLLMPGFLRPQSSADVGAANSAIAAMNKIPVVFEKGKPEIAPASQANLQKIAALFKKLPNGAIVLIGVHVSEIGENEGNVLTGGKLSESEARVLTIYRVAQIFDFLTKAGISENSIKVKGYGFSKPVAPNETAEGRAKNARVEFTLHPDSFKKLSPPAASAPAPNPDDKSVYFNKG